MKENDCNKFLFNFTSLPPKYLLLDEYSNKKKDLPICLSFHIDLNMDNKNKNLIKYF